MNCASTPMRATLAQRKNTPVSRTAPAANARRWSALCRVSAEAAAAARIAAEDDVGATMAKRLRPTSPYTSKPATAAKTPCSGAKPAMEA